ncbi:MAG: serine/threonine-protein kinase [Deltaproteobacteria bacterium]
MLRDLSPGSSVKLELGSVIGEGGMGVIHAAEQLALARTVAVKTLKPNRTGQTAIRDLLHEAWITGSLEHPNVVPVHHLELDRDGIPLIVMKKIEGVSWSVLMRTNDLVWNLGILVQVLNALRFAHHRGILHRDVKPANVMIGEFGEVYLLDWGIAVSLADDRNGRFPLASRQKDIAGTPGYMAPEMLAREGDVLSERTDVYLAGAALFEILMGRPPHVGRDALTVVTQILTVQPVVPPSVPAELARICHRALDVDPEKRFVSAEAMRQAVQSYLEHRGSTELAARAHADLARLRDPAVLAGSREEIYRLFGACRFGFHEALAEWRENADAHRGLVEATIAIAEYELAHDNPTGALALLGEIDAPQLLERAHEAVKAHAKRQADLEQFHRNLDPTIHARTRTVVGAVLGLLFTALPLIVSRVGSRDTETARVSYLVFSGAFALVVAAFGLLTRATFGSTAVNRRALGSVVCLFVGQLALGLGGWLLDLPLATTQTLAIVIWATVVGMLVLHFDRRLAASAVGYLIAFFIAARWPSTRAYATAASNFVLAINVLHTWARGGGFRIPPRQ